MGVYGTYAYGTADRVWTSDDDQRTDASICMDLAVRTSHPLKSTCKEQMRDTGRNLRTHRTGCLPGPATARCI